MRPGLRILCNVALSLTLVAAAGAQPGWAPELLEPEIEHYRTPESPIRIRMANAPADIAGRIYVEIDDVDVTGFLIFEGDVASLPPEASLSTGYHRIRVIEQEADGSMHVRGAWEIEVRQSRYFQKGALQGAVLSNTWERLGSDDIGKLPDSTQADGSLGLAFEAADRKWSAGGHAAAFWDSVDRNLGGRNLELGEFLATGTYGPGVLRAGHHEVVTNTLVMQNFNRRGMSLGLGSQKLRSSITGFSVLGEQVIGWREGMGLSDEDNRVAGVHVKTRPLETELGFLDLNGVWLDGEAPESGTVLAGIAGDQTTHAGDAWAVRGDGSFFGERVLVFGEYARSDYDFDGSGGENSYDDDAYRVGGTFRPLPELSVREQPVDLAIAFENARIGTFFRSLASPGAPQDLRIQNYRSALSVAGLSVEGSWSREKDNVNDVDGMPRFKADSWFVRSSFTPALLLGGERRGVLRWLGMPTVGGGFASERLEPASVPEHLSGLIEFNDRRTRTVEVFASFAYDTWSWTGSHTVICLDDYRFNFPDLRTDSTMVSASVPLGSRALFAPRFQFSRLKVKQGGPTRTDYLGGFTTTVELVPERVFTNFNFDINRSDSTDESQESWLVIVGGDVSWRVFQPRNYVPGLVAAVVGNYRFIDDDVISEIDRKGYQILLRFTVEWTAVVGGG